MTYFFYKLFFYPWMAGYLGYRVTRLLYLQKDCYDYKKGTEPRSDALKTRS